jgi:hypothetical protein
MKTETSVLAAVTALLTLVQLSAWGIPDDAPARTGPDRPLQLPPFIVYDSKVKDRPIVWGYEAFPGYEVLTGCGHDLTNRFVSNVGAQISILRQLAPAVFENRPTVPTELILMNEEQAHSITAAMKKAMEAGASGSAERTLVPLSKIKYFPQIRLHDQESTVISLVLDSNFSDDVILEPGYVRYLVESRIPRLPAWYADAMADLYSRASFRTSSDFGGNIYSSSRKYFSEVEFAPVGLPATGAGTVLVPLQQIFLEPSVPGNPPAPPSLKAFESSLFLQWVIADRTGTRTDALGRYLDLLGAGDGSEGAFVRCFGLTFDQALHHVRRFMRDDAGETLSHRELFIGMDIPFRDATPSEFARMWGNWELMEIRFVGDQDSSLVGPYLSQAEHTLEGAYASGAHDPGFLAVLGLFRMHKEEFSLARAALEAAASHDAAYPRAYTEIARLRFREALARPEDPQGKLSSGQTESVLNPLRVASGLFPSQRETYLLAALAYAHSSRAPGPGDRALIEEGLKKFPDDGQLILVVRALPMNTAEK